MEIAGDKNNKPLVRFLIISLGTVLAYYAFARLGLLLALPPGYATFVWPPSGIALGVVLLFGYRYCVAVCLGSMLINLFLGFDGSNFFTVVNSVSLALGIGMGAALQACLGVKLIRHYMPDTSLLEIKSILLFVFLSAFLSALVNASLSNALLWLFHINNLADIPLQWLTWYSGDALGILLFTPLMLAFFAKPRPLWRNRMMPLSILLSGLFILSTLLFMVMRDDDIHSVQQRLQKHVAPLLEGVQQEIKDIEGVLDSIVRFYNASEKVTRQEFKAFVKGALKRHPSLQALSWNPIVYEKDRPAYISLARKEGFKNFDFKKRLGGKVMKTAGANFYYVIYFIEPFLGNEKALGFDLASNAKRKKALDLARDSNKLSATEKIKLVQGGSAHSAVIMFAPVYSKNKNLSTLKQRQKHIQGFVSAVFRITSLVNNILLSQHHVILRTFYLDKNFNVMLYDISDGQKKVLFGKDKDHINKRIAAIINETKIVMPMGFANKKWRLEILPTEKYLKALFTWKSWLVMTFTLLFVGVINILLLVWTGERYRISQDLVLREKDKNDLERKHQAILNELEDAVVMVSASGEIVLANQSFLNMAQATLDKVLSLHINHYMSFSLDEAKEYYDFYNGEDHFKIVCKIRRLESGDSLLMMRRA